MEDKGKKRIVDAVTNIAGNTVGAGIGAVVAGPGGAVIGAVAGGVVQSLFQWAGDEIKDRYLSKQERKRVNQVFALASQKIIDRLEAGDKPRDEGFFTHHKRNRSAASELLEGTLLLAQREYEERKLPYIANLYSNLCFDSEVSPQVANSLIRLAGELSYQQLCIIHCVSILQTANWLNKREQYQTVVGLDNVSIAEDTFRLYRNGILHTSNSNAIISAGGINPQTLVINGLGRFLFNNMELVRMEHDELMHVVFAFFSNSSLPDVID